MPLSTPPHLAFASPLAKPIDKINKNNSNALNICLSISYLMASKLALNKELFQNIPKLIAMHRSHILVGLGRTMVMVIAQHVSNK